MPRSSSRRPARSTVSRARAVRLILSTAPEKTAGRLARTLVSERLAACVHVVPGVSSTYRWKGRVETAAESLLVVKTTGRGVRKCLGRLAELHPYEVPEGLAVNLASGLEAYLDWIAGCCAESTP